MSLYHTLGPVDPNHPTFISRQDTIREIDALITEPRIGISAYPAILGARQVGKTTLLLEIRAKYAKSWSCVSISCQGLGELNMPALYQQVVNETNQQLGLGLSVDFNFGTGVVFEEFLRRAVNCCQRFPLIFLINEIGGLRDEMAVAFAETIRKIFDVRHTVNEYGKIAFILAGSSDLASLCGSKTSPLVNVVKYIWLDDFSLEQTRQLAEVGHLDALAEQIYSWTSGHPYLTQRLCSILENNPKQTVDQAVQELLQGRDSHFEWIRRKLKENDEVTQNTALRINSGERISYNEHQDAIYSLKLIGVIKKDTQGACSIRNKIYEEVLFPHLIPPPGIYVDKQSGDVWVEGKLLDPPLTHDEFKLIAYLYERCNEICDRDDVAIAVWSGVDGVSDAAIDQMVTRVRKRIEPDPTQPRYILTVRGRGFRLVNCSPSETNRPATRYKSVR
ncbi:MAG: hypothetical protein FJZ93_09445 [Chloroflexi bacterium]|nr:hypothetical protein [Chloroflexota bacterium]